MLSEFATDYNQTHFVRDPSFKEAADKVSGETRNIFIEFLERSCTAEFSGFLLYKELGRRLKVGGRYAAPRAPRRRARARIGSLTRSPNRNPNPAPPAPHLPRPLARERRRPTRPSRRSSP